jgi:Holliday junction resolvase RusA-like endonuclease
MISFFINGIPKPQARARTFMRKGAKFPTTWSPKSDWFSVVYATALANRPKAPLDGPLCVELSLYLPKPKSAPKSKERPDVRPDLDNYEKAILDALTQAGIWTDDGRICELHSAKFYAKLQSGCKVEIKEL